MPVMTVFKHFVRICYFSLKYIFYPLVLILMLVIPAIKQSPQFIVGTYTMFLFGFLSNFLWNNTPARMILGGLMQITGISLAILFMIWGAEFEQKQSIRKIEAWNSMDTKILLWTIPLFLLAIVAGRIEELDQSDFAYPGLVAITFMCLIARGYYVQRDVASILSGICWLFGSLGFYATLWIPALNMNSLRKVAGLVVVGVLGYIFYDYGTVKKSTNYAAARAGMFVSIILYLLLFNVFGYSLRFKQLSLVLQTGVVLTVLLIAMFYWSHLSGKPVRWPWQRSGSD